MDDILCKIGIFLSHDTVSTGKTNTAMLVLKIKLERFSTQSRPFIRSGCEFLTLSFPKAMLK